MAGLSQNFTAIPPFDYGVDNVCMVDRQVPVTEAQECSPVSFECGVVAAVHTGQERPEAQECSQIFNGSSVSEDCTTHTISSLQRMLETMDQQHSVSSINIEVRAPDQLGPISSDTIAVVVKSAGFPYLSLDDLYDRIYGSPKTVRRLPLSQEPARFTLSDHYSTYHRAMKRRAWMESERKEWAQLMTRPIDAVAYRERLIHVQKSVVEISKRRALLKMALAGGEYVRTRIHIVEGLAELKMYKAFYRSFAATLQLERESQLNLLRKGLDVLKPAVRRLLDQSTFDEVCRQLGLNPNAECFCPVDEVIMRQLAAIYSDLNGTHGEWTTTDGVVSIRYFERPDKFSTLRMELIYPTCRTPTVS